MKNRSLHRRVLISALVMGLSATSLTGCGQKTSEEHLLAARQFIEAQDTESAILEFKNAIQKNPQDPNPRFELGQLYVNQGSYAAAEKELNRALELGYDVAEVIPLLTLAYQETNAEVALSEIDHSVDGLTAVKRAEVSFYKLEALIKLEKKAEARQLIDEIRQLDTNSVFKGLALAYESMLDEQYEKTLTQVEALREQSPLNKNVLQLLARLNLYLEKPDQAIEAYQAYVKAYPEDAETSFILSALLMDNERYDDAEPLVDKLLTKSAGNPLLNQYKAVIEVRAGEFASALKHVETAIQGGRTDPLARLVGGYSAYQLKDYAAATRHLSMIASNLPKTHPALRMLADSLLYQGNNEEALDVLSRVDGDFSTDATLFSKAGYKLLQDGNVVDAQTMIERSAELATTAEDLTRIGVLQLSLNDADGILNLEEAVKKAPEVSSGQQTLANAYIATKQFDKALGVAQEWKEKEPQNPEPWLTIAQVSILKNDFDAATKAIEAAESLDPQNIKAKLQRVSISLNQKKVDEGLSYLKQALDIEPTHQSALAMYYMIMKQAGKANEGIDYIKEIASRNPDSVTPNIVLARVLLSENRYEEGLSAINKVPQSYDVPMPYWDTKGRLLLANNKVNEAKELYSEWLKVSPNNKTATLGLVMILDVQNKFADALDVTKKFLEKRPDRQIDIVKSYLHAMLRQIREAEAILNKLTAEERMLPFVRGVEARLQIYREDYADAVPNALAAYDEIPSTRNLLVIMAAYELTGNNDKSFALLNTFLENNPDNLQARLLYAERMIPKDRKGAITEYRKVVKDWPDNAIALNNLAFLELEEGMLSDAEKHARQALKVIPNAPEIADTLAQILVAQGEMEDAKEVYDGIVDDNVRSDEVFLNYVELLLKMDLKTLANRRLGSRVFETQESKARVAELKKTYNI
ncbi:MAG: PEP-CTERM system TPR-repeat protein PrsT [Aestuariibacter sp.]|uniref:XrtA/PEP-CTERM system TPR-repeat protein PrsT n=1 Tax=Marisediminitalea aggregata TaxID=634436 RepID=UPI0020CDC3A3|nr:XrtA/PEP-CTERM system TPR-repeat protein PrsT [Marisediminitalea aggregata]MCP4524741.1 PEP-CTERM system TPR-repeat protein PrsT [Aestuariibacter sp.]MCP9477385.1 PEP-CTERM system TPR-repeat protein PrsT [Marisediminitalea aggregata]